MAVVERVEGGQAIFCSTAGFDRLQPGQPTAELADKWLKREGTIKARAREEYEARLESNRVMQERQAPQPTATTSLPPGRVW